MTFSVEGSFTTTEDVCPAWVEGTNNCQVGCKWPGGFPRDDKCFVLGTKWVGTGHEPDGNVCRLGDGFSTCEGGQCKGATTTAAPVTTTQTVSTECTDLPKEQTGYAHKKER